VVWKGAFGFDKGVKNDTTPTGKDKSIIEHCAGIAKAFFATGEKDSDYTNADLVHLWSVVKNQVMLWAISFHKIHFRVAFEAWKGLI